MAYLSSPRKGPHADVYNLTVLDLTSTGAKARVVFDHHATPEGAPPHLPPASPLPDKPWRDNHRVAFTVYHGLKAEVQCVDLDRGPQALHDPAPSVPRSPLLPGGSSARGPRLIARDEIVQWKSFDGLAMEGVVTRPPPSIAQPPFKSKW